MVKKDNGLIPVTMKQVADLDPTRWAHSPFPILPILPIPIDNLVTRPRCADATPIPTMGA